MTYDLKNQFSRKSFNKRVEALLEAGAVVKLTTNQNRTLNQNKFLHIALGILAMETGCSIGYIKQEVFKRRVNPDLFIMEKNDPILGHIEVLRSSRDLNKEEMSMAIDRYLKFCADNGIYIPSPEDHDMLREAEYEIAKIEQYL